MHPLPPPPHLPWQRPPPRARMTAVPSLSGPPIVRPHPSFQAVLHPACRSRQPSAPNSPRRPTALGVKAGPARTYELSLTLGPRLPAVLLPPRRTPCFSSARGTRCSDRIPSAASAVGGQGVRSALFTTVTRTQNRVWRVEDTGEYLLDERLGSGNSEMNR